MTEVVGTARAPTAQASIIWFFVISAFISFV
jgi:hypothetical protein